MWKVGIKVDKQVQVAHIIADKAGYKRVQKLSIDFGNSGKL